MNEAEDILKYYNTVMNKKARTSNYKIINKALEVYNKDDIKKAILNCSNSEFHMGNNPENKKYNSLSLILRMNSKTDKIKFFLNKEDNKEIKELKRLGFNTYESDLIYNRFPNNCLYILENNPYVFLLRTDISFIRLYKLFGDKYDYNSYKNYYYINLLEEKKGEPPNIYDIHYHIEPDNLGEFCHIENQKLYTEKRFQQKKDLIFNLHNRKIKPDLNLEYNIENFLNEKQIKALNNSKKRISIINGSAGTGKTTVISEIIKNNKNYNIAVTALSGKACEVINNKIDCGAKTIHKLLGYDLFLDSYNYNRFNRLDIDLLIVDEASMINNDLMFALFQALKYNCRVVLVGDTQQIRPIGYGQPFADFIKLKTNITTLNVIERNKDGSDIVKYSHLISQQKLNSFDEFNNDFYFIDSLSDKKSLDIYNYLISKKIKESFNYNDDDIQTLSTVKNGLLGINNLNMVAKNVFNKSHQLYSVGDKVIQTKNDYKKRVMNGMIGEIVEVNSKNIHIDYNGILVKYSNKNIVNFQHAYALTVHKSQGSEFKCVVFLINQDLSLINTEILYTAITRAQEKIIIIGNKSKFLDYTKSKYDINLYHKKQNTGYKEEEFIY